MKIAKAAAGFAGVAMALGAVSPAAAAGPLGGGEQSVRPAITGNKTPLDAVGGQNTKQVVTTVHHLAKKLKDTDATSAASKVTGAKKGTGAL
ncbi:hypothetical protein ABZ626_35745 [Streptomyces longispororuber]|uniref:hypothetical protein n=1 Tax=Streptomyces TaxID=1883 RepID=UPI0024A89794|nr:hypothetical protein [Streptomyces sp. CC224B]